MWIARDKSGKLYLYSEKPYRVENCMNVDDFWCRNENDVTPFEVDETFGKYKITWTDEPQEAYIFTEKDLVEIRNRCSAVSLMNYLDDNKRADKKMCLSNGECEQIDKAFAANDWTTIIKYIRKYIDIESL